MRLERLCADACSCPSHLLLGVAYFTARTAAPWLRIRTCEIRVVVTEVPGKESHDS